MLLCTLCNDVRNVSKERRICRVFGRVAARRTRNFHGYEILANTGSKLSEFKIYTKVCS